MNLQEVFRRELDIVAVHLIVIFSFHEERSIDVRKELIRHFFKVISEVGGVFRMVGNVILLDKLFKNREIKVTGNILSTCICIGIEVNPVNLVTAGVKGYSRLRIVCDREFFHDLQQPVIQRIFFEPVIELFASQLLVKQRELRIKEDDLLLVKRQQLVFLCADIDRVTKMIAVFLLGLRRRVQLIKGRLKRLCHIAVQRFQHSLASCGQVGVVRNDRIHCFAHHGKDEVTLRCTGVHFLIAHAERTPAA